MVCVPLYNRYAEMDFFCYIKVKGQPELEVLRVLCWWCIASHYDSMIHPGFGYQDSPGWLGSWWLN